MNRIAKIATTTIATALLSMSNIHFAMAGDVGYGDDHTTAGGGGSCANGCNVNCYHFESCPHWILAPISIFQKAVNETKNQGIMSVGDTSVCTDPAKNPDGYVVFSGNYRSKDSPSWQLMGSLRYYNLSPMTVNPKKETKVYTEFIDGGNSSTKYTDWNLTGNNIFTRSLNKKIASLPNVNTYGDLLNYVTSAVGVSETSLSYFCAGIAEQIVQDSYYTSSHASNRASADATDGGGYETTGISNSKKTATTAKRQAQVGDTVPITFSHDIYSSKAKTGVSWTVKRTTNDGAFLNSAKYTIATPSSKPLSDNTTSASTSGTANINVDRGSSVSPRYQAPQNYTDGGTAHFYRNYYKVTFKQEGTYKFCETIYVGGIEYTTACSVVEVGKPDEHVGECSNKEPSAYKNSNIYSGATSSWTSISSNVFPGENQMIYAKPNDTIYFEHCYFPGAQAVKKSSGSHEEPTPSGGRDESTVSVTNTIGEHDTFVEINNKFTIDTDNSADVNPGPQFPVVSGPYTNSGNTFIGTRGDASSAYVKTNSMTIKTSAVADTVTQSLSSKIGTNSVSGHSTWSWTYTYTCTNCCSCFDHYEDIKDAEGNVTGQKPVNVPCDCDKTGYGSGKHTNSGDDNWYKVSNETSSSVGSSASVYVPYNYRNTGTVGFTTQNIFAGETFTVSSAPITVHTRYNAVTKGDYATKTPSATIKLYTFYSSNKTDGGDVQTTSTGCSYYSGLGYQGCTEAATASSALNKSYNYDGSNNDSFFDNNTYNVHDIPAGYQFCIGISIFPAESAADNIGDDNGKTYYSAPTCKVVNKRPTFQVWGGSFYSAGAVSASSATKNNLAGGIYSYSPNSSLAKTVYTPWVEIAVASNGPVKNLASGAATSYTYTNKNAANYAGKISTQPCQRARLSFANSICSGGTTGSSGIAADYSIKNTIISRYATEDKYISNTVTVAGKTIPQKTVEVTYASGVNITGDILYEETAYVSASQVPQYIIYSKGNININCNVNRIDAWLVADGTINTCSSAANATVTNGLIDDASGIRSRQLKINGVIIADQLILGRTYGAATGSNSGTPAEIINLSGASYIWAENTASDTPKLYTTYLRELAPRY